MEAPGDRSNLDMGEENLHIFFLPFLAPGHMIPMVDLAKLFSLRGVRCTIVTTVGNAASIEPSISNFQDPTIQLLTLPFPSSVPENVAKLPTPDLTPPFLEAIDNLRQPFERLVGEHRPDCIVSDVFYPWTAELAFEHAIPRLAFHGTCAFISVVLGVISTLKPYEGVSDEHGTFVVPEIPHRVEMVKSQLPGSAFQHDDVVVKIVKAQSQSYGTIMNTFVGLEDGYVEKLKGKAWFVGPVSLCNRDTKERASRGGKISDIASDCINWLETQKPGSVIYACFGSLGQFTDTQLHEIAIGLRNADHPFIWVLKNVEETQDWMPEESQKGLIIRGWAPQIEILNHPSVGGFMTHCGWNSCLEGVTAGVPMVTWPLFAEQFVNERLMVDVLKIGVSVGAKVCSGTKEERTLVKNKEVTKVVKEAMGGGEDGDQRRKRAKEFAEMAKKAMEAGGSSYEDMSRLIKELMDDKNAKVSGLECKN